MFIKACAISIALSVLGASFSDRKTDPAKDCKDSDPLCPPIQAISAGVNHMYAALMAR